MRRSTVKYATQAQLNSTFDSTSKFWTNLNGSDFLNRLDKGLMDITNERVQRVLKILNYVRP
jgi:hypothetical protein